MVINGVDRFWRVRCFATYGGREMLFYELSCVHTRHCFSLMPLTISTHRNGIESSMEMVSATFENLLKLIKTYSRRRKHGEKEIVSRQGKGASLR